MAEPPTGQESQSSREPEEIVGEWLVDCRHAMVAVGLRFCRDEDLANEMAQEACLLALRRVRDEPGLVEEIEKPCPWLAGIAANVARRWLRDQALHARILEENALEIGEKMFPSGDREWTLERRTEKVLAVAQGVLTPKQSKGRPS